MAKQILVTGASGLIGREFIKQLSQDFDVTGVDNNFRYPNYFPDCTYIKSNIAEYLIASPNTFDYVFHMAAINGTKYFYEIPNLLLENNITSDLAVFHFVKKNPVCKLIYASSSEIVSDTDMFPTPEHTDILLKNIHNPRWSYRLGKIVAENYLMNSDINFLILRFFNIFGACSAEGHFIGDILKKIDVGNYELIGADETRSFCRVDDAVNAVLRVYQKVSGEVINVGSNEEITIFQAAHLISKQKNKNIQWQPIPGKEGSCKRRKPCLKKLYQYYPDFNPKKFKDAIKDF